MLDSFAGILVLGANGFIGKEIFSFLSEAYQVKGFSKPDFDITNPDTYHHLDLDKTIIIDCIARISGEEGEIERVNVEGFDQFLTFLETHHFTGKYVYLSTLSVLKPSLILSNKYLESKAKAENLLKQKIRNYQVIRLAFPIGSGQSEERLIPRLIGQLKRNEEINIDSVRLNITPVEAFLNNLEEIVFSDSIEVNFTDGVVYTLEDICRKLASLTGSLSSIHVRADKTLDLTFNPSLEVKSFEPLLLKTLSKMSHETI